MLNWYHLYKETKRLFLPRDSPSRVYPKLCQSMINDEFLNQLAHFTATSVGTEGGFCTNKGMSNEAQNYEIKLAANYGCLAWFVNEHYTVNLTKDQKINYPPMCRVPNSIYAGEVRYYRTDLTQTSWQI